MGSKTTSTKVQFSQFLLLLKFVDGYFSLSTSFDFKNQFLYPLVWLDHFEPNFKCKTASESYKHRDYTSSIHFSKAGKSLFGEKPTCVLIVILYPLTPRPSPPYHSTAVS